MGCGRAAFGGTENSSSGSWLRIRARRLIKAWNSKVMIHKRSIRVDKKSVIELRGTSRDSAVIWLLGSQLLYGTLWVQKLCIWKLFEAFRNSIELPRTHAILCNTIRVIIEEKCPFKFINFLDTHRFILGGSSSAWRLGVCHSLAVRLPAFCWPEKGFCF